MSDCSYAAMSNHKLTVANLCVKSNSLWTNFADNGKIHTCMYNVCTLYTTAVGVISPRQLACLLAPKWIRYLVQRLLDAVCTMYVRCMYARWRLVNDWRRLSRTFSVEAFCSLRSHGTRFAYGRLRAQALSQPCLVMGRVRCVERCK